MSPNQHARPRTMASDFTKLFRSGSSIPQSVDGVAQAAAASETPKKKITRIPLFGRTRKQSNPSSSSSPYLSTSVIRPSTAADEMSCRTGPEPERRPSLPILSAPLPSSSKASFTTKFAAHFSSSQSTKSDIHFDSRASSSRISLISAPSSTSLLPPRPRPSYESGSSSRGSRTGSTTPRGTTFTENMDGFRDPFAKDLPSSKTALKTSGKPQVSGSTQDPNQNSVSRSSTMYRRGQTPASVLAACVRDQQGHKRQPSSSSRKTTDSEKSADKLDGRATPRLSSPRESPRLVQVPEKEDRRPQSPASRRPSSSQSSQRLRIRTPVTGIPTKPPSIPLPDIPSPSSESPSPMKLDGMDLPETDFRAAAEPAQQQTGRSRANTISSIPELPPTPISAQDQSGNTTMDPVNVEDIDIDTASPESLRRALRSRNKQLEELSAYVSRREAAWFAERKVLEKRVSVLQRDLVRRESEITGLKLIINDEDVLRRPRQKPVLPGILDRSHLSPGSTSPVQSDQEGSISGSRRLNYQSDSGAESPRGSGNESSSSIMRLKRMHQRTSAIAGDNYVPRTGSSSRLPKLAQERTTSPSSSDSPYSLKRLSIASSASSGSSSLMPPTPSPSATMSSLSAIPEGSPHESIINASSEDRRGYRASRRISSSSMTSSSTGASSAYSANIKRSRPPSIAQVLEKSPDFDDVLEKLRPFAV